MRKKVIPWGDAGTMGSSLPAIEDLIADGRTDPVVRQQAEAILYGVPERDFHGDVRAIFGWVTNKLRYTHDPTGTEWVQTPRRFISKANLAGEVYADCDCAVVATASLLESVGYKTFLVPSKADPRRDDYSHIYLEVEGPKGERLVLDPILPNPKIGKKVPHEHGREVIQVERHSLKRKVKHAVGWTRANWAPLLLGGVVAWAWLTKPWKK